MSDPYAIVANCAARTPTTPRKAGGSTPSTNEIPYDWSIRQH